MSLLEELVKSLVEHNPDDRENLQDALNVLSTQHITTFDTLARLNDRQWKRLDLPIRIESMLHNEVLAVEKAVAEKIAASWERYYDDRYRRHYYWNSVTDESQWTRPK